MSERRRESGMLFTKGKDFDIEHSIAYKALGRKFKSVEFVRREGRRLMFVEAKATKPNPDEGKEKFDKDAGEIVEKFVHSLNLYSSIAIGVNVDDITETNMQPDKRIQIEFVLIIRNLDKRSCDRVQKKLDSTLNQDICQKNIWQPKVLVINHALAVEFGLTETTATA